MHSMHLALLRTDEGMNLVSTKKPIENESYVNPKFN